MPRPVNIGQVAAGEGQAAVDALVGSIAAVTADNLANSEPSVLSAWMGLFLTSPDFTEWQEGIGTGETSLTMVREPLPRPDSFPFTPSDVISKWLTYESGAYLFVGTPAAPTAPVLVLLDRDSALRMTVIDAQSIGWTTLRPTANSGSSLVSINAGALSVMRSTGAMSAFTNPEVIDLTDVATSSELNDGFDAVTEQINSINQMISSDLATNAALDGKADKAHGHAMDDITDLVLWKNLVASELLKKADKVHTHKIADVEQLETRLADNYALAMDKASINDENQTVNLGTLMFAGDFVVGTLDHPDYGYRLFAASAGLFDGDTSAFAFGQDLDELYTQVQKDIAQAVSGGVDTDAIQALIDDAVAASELVTLSKHDDDLALKADRTELSPFKTGEWRSLPLKTEYVPEGAKKPYYRLLPGNNVQIIGEIKHRDGLEFPVDAYTGILATAGIAADCRPSTAQSWTAPTYGGTPTGAHANIGVGTAGTLSVNPKLSSPLKVELSGIYYCGPWPA